MTSRVDAHPVGTAGELAERVPARPRTVRRALIAESDGQVAGTLAGVLEGLGYDVAIAAGVEQAWELYRNDRFNAVLCGKDGPRRDGLELARRIRLEDRDGYTYLIALGREPGPAGFERGMAAGADDFMAVPVEPEALLARLRVAERIDRMQTDIARKNRTLSDANQQLELANERIRRELESAARVQQALLPSARLQVPGLRIGWRLRPCAELAGDILNCIRLDEHHLAFYVLDVSGHGVSAALLSVQVSRLMSPMMSESELLKQRLKEPPWYRVVEPKGVVRRLNELFQTHGEMTQYFTMIYGLVHLETGRVRLVSAGHPGPVHAPADGEPVELVCRSHPVGLFERTEVAEHELTLGPGDRIWLYSDGVTEASDSDQHELGLEGLKKQIEARRDRPVAAAVDEVMAAVEDWSRPLTPSDDCTLLAIEAGERRG